MKTRTKRAAVEGTTQPLITERGVVHFLEVRQSPMLVIKDDTFIDYGGDVRGAYVKVSPTIRTSERARVDQKAVRERLLGAGAAAVVVAPVVVPDAAEARTEALEAPEQAQSPEAHLRDWFAGVKAEPELVEEALAQALFTVGEAGL